MSNSELAVDPKLKATCPYCHKPVKIKLYMKSEREYPIVFYRMEIVKAEE